MSRGKAKAFVVGDVHFHATDAYTFRAAAARRHVHRLRQYDSDKEQCAWLSVERNTATFTAFFAKADDVRAAIAELQAALAVMEAEPTPCPDDCYRCKLTDKGIL
jgi:hypothetical protein